MCAQKRIKSELNYFNKNPPKNITACPIKDSDLFNWKASFYGLEGSPYENGIFNLDIHFPTDYPFSPPICHFCEHIFHPNISGVGSITLDILRKDDGWSPALTIGKVLTTIYSLLIYPNLDESLNNEAYLLYKQDKYEYYKKAHEFTIKYGNYSDKGKDFHIFYLLKGIDRINYELNNLEQKKNFSISKVKGFNFKYKAIIIAPKLSLFEGKKLNLDFYFSEEYPFEPPKFTFSNKIKDINTDKIIELCEKCLKDKWSNKSIVRDILYLLSDLFNFNFIYDCLSEEKKKNDELNEKIKQLEGLLNDEKKKNDELNEKLLEIKNKNNNEEKKINENKILINKNNEKDKTEIIIL